MSFFWWSVTLLIFGFVAAFIGETRRSNDAALFWFVIMAMLRFAAICCFAIWIIRVAIGTV